LSEPSAGVDKGFVTLENCAAVAALCAASIAECCRDFPIYETGRTVGLLNLHCALGVGDVAAVHVGDDRLKREFLLVGDPIDQVGFLLVYIYTGNISFSASFLSF
jgi:hypothetical protein